MNGKSDEKKTVKTGSPRKMLRQTRSEHTKKDELKLFSEEDIKAVFACVSQEEREKLAAGYDLKALARIFEDESAMETVNALLRNDLSVCRTARELYMHRNTLVYRLNTIYRRTGLDVRNFEMAVTFKILHYLYLLK